MVAGGIRSAYLSSIVRVQDQQANATAPGDVGDSFEAMGVMRVESMGLTSTASSTASLSLKSLKAESRMISEYAALRYPLPPGVGAGGYGCNTNNNNNNHSSSDPRTTDRHPPVTPPHPSLHIACGAPSRVGLKHPLSPMPSTISPPAFMSPAPTSSSGTAKARRPPPPPPPEAHHSRSLHTTTTAYASSTGRGPSGYVGTSSYPTSPSAPPVRMPVRPTPRAPPSLGASPAAQEAVFAEKDNASMTPMHTASIPGLIEGQPMSTFMDMLEGCGCDVQSVVEGCGSSTDDDGVATIASSLPREREEAGAEGGVCAGNSEGVMPVASRRLVVAGPRVHPSACDAPARTGLHPREPIPTDTLSAAAVYDETRLAAEACGMADADNATTTCTSSSRDESSSAECSLSLLRMACWPEQLGAHARGRYPESVCARGGRSPPHHPGEGVAAQPQPQRDSAGNRQLLADCPAEGGLGKPRPPPQRAVADVEARVNALLLSLDDLCDDVLRLPAGSTPARRRAAERHTIALGELRRVQHDAQTLLLPPFSECYLTCGALQSAVHEAMCRLDVISGYMGSGGDGRGRQPEPGAADGARPGHVGHAKAHQRHSHQPSDAASPPPSVQCDSGYRWPQPSRAQQPPDAGIGGGSSGAPAASPQTATRRHVAAQRPASLIDAFRGSGDVVLLTPEKRQGRW